MGVWHARCALSPAGATRGGMRSKPRTLAGILHGCRAADAAYNRARHDPEAAAVYRPTLWSTVCGQVLRDEPVYCACAAAGRTERATQVDHVVDVVDLR